MKFFMIHIQLTDLHTESEAFVTDSGECNGFGSRLKFWSMYTLMAISSLFIGSIFAKRTLGYIDTLYDLSAKSNP